MKRSLIFIYGVLLGLASAACSGPGPEELVPNTLAQFGLIAITYSHDWEQSQQEMLLTTNAQFVSFSAMNRKQVSQLLALPLDPDHDLPPPDQCRIHTAAKDLAEEKAMDGEDPGNVELLEAGELHVETERGQITLSPKHFPGLLPFISGVVYTEAQETYIRKPGKVRAVSYGSEAVGSFTAELNSPDIPRLIQVGASQPESNNIHYQGEDLFLQWEPWEPSPGDVTYIELRTQRGEVVLRCHPHKDGAFEIPAKYMTSFSGRRTILEVARVRRVFFLANGLDEGELRSTTVDTIILN